MAYNSSIQDTEAKESLHIQGWSGLQNEFKASVEGLVQTITHERERKGVEEGRGGRSSYFPGL